MTAAERLRYIINELKETPNSFAKSVGLSQSSSIYNILNQKAPLTRKMAQRIIATYQNININWLLYGEGEIFNWQNNQAATLNEPANIYEKKYIVADKNERIIKLLEGMIEEQKKVIEDYRQIIKNLEKCLEEFQKREAGDIEIEHKANTS